MGGAILQTSGATILTPGIFRMSSTRPAGSSLKTGAGASARMTISPSILARVLPINERIPWVRLKRPRIATIGIVRPTTARSVRIGRVIRFCQAKRHMKSSLFARIGWCQTPRPYTYSRPGIALERGKDVLDLE